MNEPEDKMDGSAMPFGTGDDAWLERLLREDAAVQSHIQDDGFSARVMAGLPARAKPAPAWLVPAMTMAGCALAAAVTPAGDHVFHSLMQLTDWRHFHPSNLLALVPVAVVYACSFFSASRED
jgi:hypothetical protein